MTLQNSGLNNSGLTQNFQVEYQDTFYTGLPPSQATQVQDNLIANANYLLGVVEGTFNTTTGWFGTDYPPRHRPIPSRFISTAPTAPAPPTTATASRSTSTARARTPPSPSPARSGDGVVQPVGRDLNAADERPVEFR